MTMMNATGVTGLWLTTGDRPRAQHVTAGQKVLIRTEFHLLTYMHTYDFKQLALELAGLSDQ